MKTLSSLFFASFFLTATIASAQTKTETLNVNGECGMCKTKIEKAAKTAGASYAAWDADTKVLTVKYNQKATTAAKIEKAVAGTGYDTQNVKATDAAYNSLHACCKYDRTAGAEKAEGCCEHEACKGTACVKNGTCSKDASCCKEAGCDTKACCKKA